MVTHEAVCKMVGEMAEEQLKDRVPSKNYEDIKRVVDEFWHSFGRDAFGIEAEANRRIQDMTLGEIGSAIIRAELSEMPFDEAIAADRQMLFSRKGKDGKETRGANLSDKKNLEGFRNYVKQILPAPLPKRLESGSPRAALAWFEENMVGQTFSFDIPGYGHREFTPKPGHIGKLVCGGGKKADGTKIVKGRIAKANGNAALGMEMVRRGEISSADVEGWDSNRAKSLPLVPVVLREFDLGLHEVDPQGNDIIIFAKKFTNRRGRSNIIVMKLVGDSLMGPISSHMSDMTRAWLENKDLLLTDKGEVYDGSANNSASRSPSRGDNAEGNSPKDGTSIPHSAEGAQGGNLKFSRSPLPEVNALYPFVYPL